MKIGVEEAVRLRCCDLNRTAVNISVAYLEV